MSTIQPVVSVILPTYNGAGYISKAITSVLAQTYQAWELIVISDGSTDDTAEVVSHFLHDPRISYHQNEKNLGIQKTLNRGLALAKGKYIARIDDDDSWYLEEKLDNQVRFLEMHPDHVLVGTGLIIVDEDSKELIRYLVPANDESIRSKILGKNCFVHSTVMFDKQMALLCGGYDETKSTLHMEDYDLWLQLGTKGKFANLPMYSTMFTLRAEGLSSKNKMTQATKALSIAKKYKNEYPNYYASIIRSLARIVVYGFILRFPIKIFVNRLAKWYKENW